MKKLIMLLVIAFLLLLPMQGSARSYCLNESWTRENMIIDSDNPKTIDEFCPNGCDSDRGKCNEPFNPTQQQANMSLILFIIVLVMSFGALVIGFLKKRLSAMFISFVLFVVLALQSFSFDIVLAGTQFSGLTTVFIGVCWLFALISFVSILVGMVSFVRKKPRDNQGM